MTEGPATVEFVMAHKGVRRKYGRRKAGLRLLMCVGMSFVLSILFDGEGWRFVAGSLLLSVLWNIIGTFEEKIDARVFYTDLVAANIVTGKCICQENNQHRATCENPKCRPCSAMRERDS